MVKEINYYKESIDWICPECSGEGFVSECCGGSMNEHESQCFCGKFAKKEFCCEGSRVLKIGDKVRFLVCAYSSESVKKDMNCYPTHYTNSKYFYGKVERLGEDQKVWLKIKYRRDKNLVQLGLEDLDYDY